MGYYRRYFEDEDMTRREKRCLFTRNLAKLIEFIFQQGYEAAIDRDGLKHMKNSLHYDGLAKDIILYKDGNYLVVSSEYHFAGEYWKSLHALNRWGGDFPGDGNHFSMEDGGRA